MKNMQKRLRGHENAHARVGDEEIVTGPMGGAKRACQAGREDPQSVGGARSGGKRRNVAGVRDSLMGEPTPR